MASSGCTHLPCLRRRPLLKDISTRDHLCIVLILFITLLSGGALASEGDHDIGGGLNHAGAGGSSFRTIDLHYSLDLGHTWYPRGTAVCRAVTRGLTCSLDVSEPLGAVALGQLEKLSHNSHAVKLRASQHESGTRGSPLLASVSARDLLASELRDTLELHFDQEHSLTGLSYSTAVRCSKALAPCTHGKLSSTTSPAAAFVTTITATKPTEAEKPKLHTTQKPAATSTEKGGASTTTGADEQQPPAEQKSFFQRYWLYIAIGLVYIVVNATKNASETIARQQQPQRSS